MSAVQDHFSEYSIVSSEATFSTNIKRFYCTSVTYLNILHEVNAKHLFSSKYSTEIVSHSGITYYSHKLQSSVIKHSLSGQFGNIRIRYHAYIGTFGSPLLLLLIPGPSPRCYSTSNPPPDKPGSTNDDSVWKV